MSKSFRFVIAVKIATLMAGSLALASGHSADHHWLTGKIIDQNRARYLAMIYHSGNSSTTTTGTVNANGQSTTLGDTTMTNIQGSYSGNSQTNYSGSDMPLYKVYENLIIEGDDMVYVTQERLRWRWSKAARVTVNGEVEYYADGEKLHVLDNDGKEHVIEIVKQIQKNKQPTSPVPIAPRAASVTYETSASNQATVEVSSSPGAADIEIDGKFVGSTPSTIGVTSSTHHIVLRKRGYADWQREITISGSHISINADLTPEGK